MILVSIVTVAFNSEKTIAQTIESVLNQSYENIEYIIKDGISTDKTLAIAKSYEDAFKKKKISYQIISNKDAGIYNAMNIGISKTTGEIVGLINSDDWYELNTIKRVVDCYAKTNFDLFYADTRIIKSDKKVIKRVRLRNKYMTTRDWSHPTTFIKRNIYHKYHYRCLNIYDDFDLILRLHKGNYKTIILNEVLANFRIGGISSKKNIKEMLYRIKSRYIVYRNNKYSRFYIIECIVMEVAKYLLS